MSCTDVLPIMQMLKQSYGFRNALILPIATDYGRQRQSCIEAEAYEIETVEAFDSANATRDTEQAKDFRQRNASRRCNFTRARVHLDKAGAERAKVYF